MLGWGNAVTIIPEMLYRQYGTDRYLREQYDSMKSHVDCEIRHMGGAQGVENLWIAPNLGDWLCPGRILPTWRSTMVPYPMPLS